jgi:hypothetical protein
MNEKIERIARSIATVLNGNPDKLVVPAFGAVNSDIRRPQWEDYVIPALHALEIAREEVQ